MKWKHIILLLPLLLLLINTGAQTTGNKTGFWRVTSYYGEVKLNVFYRLQNREGTGLKEKQKSSLLSGGILLRTRNYIWHPNFMQIDIDGEYSPTRANDKFLVLPDQAENLDMKKLDTRITFFPQKKLSLLSYFNSNRLNNSRENLSSIRSASDNLGATAYYQVKNFPVSLGYSHSNQDETELQTGRRFLNKQKKVEGRVSATLRKMDKHDLVVTYHDFFRKDYSKFEVSNQIRDINYNSIVYWNAKKRHSFNTMLSGVWQKGYETFNRYQAIENTSWQLLKSLVFSTNYMFFSDQRNLQQLNQHKIGGRLRHNLFESLRSQIGYDYNTSSHPAYQARLSDALLDLAYTKVVMKHHSVDVGYRHNRQSQHWQSGDGLVNVIGESVTLKDGLISLLLRPYVTVASIRVRDATGTIIYQENFDYQVILQNNYVQLLRIPSGQIPDNTIVYVDYAAVQPGTYSYNSNSYVASAALNFFDRTFGVYFRKSRQDYDKLENADLLTLNYFHQYVLGAKADYHFITAGAELDNMKSIVLPYKLLHYYINYQKTLSNELIVSLNANLYDYKKLNNLSNIIFLDMSGTAAYHIMPQILISTTLTYRKQNGETVDLDLFSNRTEVSATIQKLKLSIFYNYYDRAMFDERITFNALNFQLIRKF